MAHSESKEGEFAVYRVGKSHFTHDNKAITLPDGWIVVEAGDAALTRRVKSAGEYWVIKGMYRGKPTNVGLCAPAQTVDRLRSELATERQSPDYAKRLAAGRAYRERKQAQYEVDFEQTLLAWLNFAPRYHAIAQKLAKRVTSFATVVGSGTVARTQRISIEERARAAVIAWMRHCTTNYDEMYIERGNDRRRMVRRQLAQQSIALLNRYRRDADIDLDRCPLALALAEKRDDIVFDEEDELGEA